MFKGIVLTGLVFFAAISVITACAPDEAKTAKEEPVSESTNWAEYGRIDKGELSLEITVNKTVTADSSNIPVRLVFKNTGTRVSHIFKVDTGYESELYNPVLSVTQNGNEISYRGEMAKIAVSKEWFVDVKPGDTFTNAINLLAYYPMTLKSGDMVVLKYDRSIGVDTKPVTLIIQ